MKKNLLLLLGLLLALPTFARDFEYTYEGQTLTYTVIDEDAKTCQTKAGSDYKTPGNQISGELIIPEKASYGSIDYSVTSIDDYGFAKCSGLTSVTIPNSVTSIGTSAFTGCSGLTKAEFASIESLCNIDFQNVFSNPLRYAHLYINGEEVTNPVIPNSVTSIGSYAFSGCSGLTTVTIPESVTTIGNDAFSDCVRLTEIVIPSSVKFIGNSAFNGCYIDKVHFSSMESICGITFDGSSANPLEKCGGLYINGVEVTDIVIPESVSSIGKYAFPSWYTKWKSLKIPASLKFIEDSAFGSYFYAIEIEKIEYASVESMCKMHGHTLIPRGKSTYINGKELGKDITEIVIPETVDSIIDEAFMNLEGIESVTIPESVVYIGGGVFGGSRNIKTVYYNAINAVNDSGWGIFDQASPIDKVIFGDNVRTIPNALLAGCNKLEYINIPESVITIGSSAFAQCHSLSSITIPNSVTSIGKNAFLGCYTLKEVALGNGLKAIGSTAFAACALEEVVVPPSVEYIEASAFANNANLATVTMGHNVISIGDKAYTGCAVDNVFITALNPPSAADSTFSRYSGRLWVPNAKAVQAYTNAPTCWNQFQSYAMIEPEELKIEGESVINATPGDTIRLTATISPENVTLPQIFWRSTNTDIATVDHNGVVVIRSAEPGIHTYAQGDDYNEGDCRIIAESLYADAPIAEVVINSELADIEDIIIDRQQSATIDYTAPYDVYNMQGVWLGRSMDAAAPGFYILRQGSKAAKVMK